MERIKLVFVIYSLQKGGAERVLSTLSNSFSARDYEVTIICMNNSDPRYPISEAIRIVSLLNRNARQHIFRRIQYGALTGFHLLKLLREIKPHCVVSFMTSANLWTGICCGVLKIPYIVSERTTPEHTINRFGFLLKYLSYRVYSKSSAIVLPARGIENCLRKNGSFNKLDNYKIIKNPVHPFRAITEKKVHPRKFILAIGRLAYVKGFDLLIDAFSQLNSNDTDLLILGQGPERERLHARIAGHGLTNRVFLPGVKDELQDYYAQATLFVLSSRNEGYPNVLIEAMSAGCACIAADCEFGPAEIIEHGINGMLIPAGETGPMVSMISALLSNEPLRHNLGEQAKKVNRTNSLQVIADQWEELILTKLN